MLIYSIYSVNQAVTQVPLCSSVVFLVFSQRNSISARLRSDAVLHCSFRHREVPPEQEVAVGWRLQHKGKGWKVLHMETRLDEAESRAAGGCCVDGGTDVMVTGDLTLHLFVVSTRRTSGLQPEHHPGRRRRRLCDFDQTQG